LKLLAPPWEKRSEPLHVPDHVAGLDVELVLEDASCPQRGRLLVIRDADAFALQVLGVVLSDAGRFSDQDLRVVEVAIVQDGQHAITPALLPGLEEARDRHLGDVVAVELELVVEHVHATREAQVLQLHLLNRHLAPHQRQHPVIRIHRQRQRDLRHTPARVARTFAHGRGAARPMSHVCVPCAHVASPQGGTFANRPARSAEEGSFALTRIRCRRRNFSA
jgi:hypothetical protein